MTKRDISTLHDIHPWHSRYIRLTDDLPPLEVLKKHAVIFTSAEVKRLDQLGNLVYAPGKWTIRGTLQHLIDTERILSYRALCLTRNEQADLPNYDEAAYARYVDTSCRSIADLLTEFDHLRQGTLLLYQNFTDEMLRRVGVAAGKRVSVLALAYIMAGHPLHHLAIIQQKYLPLLNNPEI
ncbi:DinB family protein [Mucilaginibacter sp. 14171R-50]|uniref:DinB family protein n=1 Tax=Mucilaginibacter sp. 14171R-50 TaxID=2703789 RepID=UPI00138C1A46|nr:DinB family protein [Mucilaginibacter sp. 14171R-50]QHS56417.1 DinB family protein [Mucilaginibacter sp. 14171R-50]